MKFQIKNKKEALIFIIFGMSIFGIFLVSAVNNPQGFDSYNMSNSTKGTVGGATVNISGGYIATLNFTANIQDTRWKAFIGRVSGKFSLQDSSGSTIYDWSLSSITGKIYASRNSSTVAWSSINCSNFTTLNQENIDLAHTNANDNLTVTFNTTVGATHSSFYVGSRYIANSTCPTLNTYVNNATQDAHFEEMGLYDGFNVVYASILDPNHQGYNGQNYDFQMIVPENGASSFTSSTAYYLYVELGN